MSQPPAVARAVEMAARIPADDLPRLRRRMRWILFTVAAFGSTGYIAAVTVGTLVAAELSDGAALGGLPTSTTTIGTAVAASLIALVMLRAGRRIGLLLGLVVGVLGGALAFLSVLSASIPLLLLGSAFTGFANAAGNLGRYIAADMATPDRRASALGLVVWGTTIGAVIGPNLTAPAGDLALALGLPELAGPYLLTVVFIGLAWVISAIALRPEPYALADPSALPTEAAAHEEAPALRTIVARPSVAVALVTLVGAQVVMVLIMTMTPIHLTAHGSSPRWPRPTAASC
jgi:MFS family permease